MTGDRFTEEERATLEALDRELRADAHRMNYPGDNTPTPRERARVYLGLASALVGCWAIAVLIIINIIAAVIR